MGEMIYRVVYYDNGKRVVKDFKVRPATSYRGIDLSSKDKTMVQKFIKTVDYKWSGFVKKK